MTVTDVEASWLAGLGLSTFVALHLETTGLDPEEDRIIEIGAVRFVSGRATASFQRFLRCDRPLDEAVRELTGITDRDLADAPSFANVADELLKFVGEDPLVGHTTDFQLAFLRTAGQEVFGPMTYNPFAYARAPVVDVALVARVFWPEWTGYSLPQVADRLDLRMDGLRRAEADARRIGELLFEMVRRLPERVWHELAKDLYRLIGSTTHRSRFFFAALPELSKNIPKPRPLRQDDGVAADSNAIAEEVADLLGPKGAFESKLSFFDARPVQLQMAEAVEQAFLNDEILLVEAPTGVGKSLAYLVPALKWALEESEDERQVIVSSYTKMLQEQLHRKDIGEIRAALGKRFRSAVLKGRNNYLCKRRLRALLREAHERLSEFDRIQLMQVLRWADLTTTGDVSELGAFNVKAQSFLWSQIASDALACAGPACSAAKGDFHKAAQERASQAQIVFINHALLFADFARLTIGGEERRRFVLDEAHQVEKAAVSAMSVELSPLVFRNALANVLDERTPRGLLSGVSKSHGHFLSDKSQELVSDTLERGRALYQSARQHFAQLSERVVGSDSGRTPKVRFRNGDGWHREATHILSPLYLQWTEFGSKLNRVVEDVAELRGEQRLSSESLTELRSAADGVLKVSENFERLLNDDDDNWVKWIEAGRSDFGGWCSLYMAPVYVGALMQKSVWPGIGGAVLTSATLSVAGDFGMARFTLGLDQDGDRPVRELTLKSPYALDEQMRMLVPTFLPDPRGSDSGFVQALGETCAEIIEQQPRATVILCTSNEMVERLTQIIAPAARRTGRPLFSQWRNSSTIELLAEYRKHRNSILIGAATFWEGMDLVGDALEILVVSKLPFDVPTDPWVSARCDALQRQGKDAFMDYSLPAATLRLKQGIGRLIRHPLDRGVAIIADPRLISSRYGETVRESLPGTLRPVRSRELLLSNIEAFFGATAGD